MLYLPHGLEVIGNNWFIHRNVEKVFIPSTVRELGEYAFAYCRQLREVVFEPGSQLETIGERCFENCGLEEVMIPKSVRDIGNSAFCGCHNLRSLSFEEGSQLVHVGKYVINSTQVDLKKVKFPSTA